MRLSIFNPEPEPGIDPATGRPADASPNCRCGFGWCEEHGTDHMPLETEAVLEVLRAHGRSSRFARRVIRKRLEE